MGFTVFAVSAAAFPFERTLDDDDALPPGIRTDGSTERPRFNFSGLFALGDSSPSVIRVGDGEGFRTTLTSRFLGSGKLALVR